MRGSLIRIRAFHSIAPRIALRVTRRALGADLQAAAAPVSPKQPALGFAQGALG